MALSDVFVDAALALADGAEHYLAPDYPIDYPPEWRNWIANLARILAVSAGNVQDGRPPIPLPQIPEGTKTTFAGPQLLEFEGKGINVDCRCDEE